MKLTLESQMVEGIHLSPPSKQQLFQLGMIKGNLINASSYYDESTCVPMDKYPCWRLRCLVNAGPYQPILVVKIGMNAEVAIDLSFANIRELVAFKIAELALEIAHSRSHPMSSDETRKVAEESVGSVNWTNLSHAEKDRKLATLGADGQLDQVEYTLKRFIPMKDALLKYGGQLDSPDAWSLCTVFEYGSNERGFKDPWKPCARYAFFGPRETANCE